MPLAPGDGDAASAGDQVWLVGTHGSDLHQVPAEEGALVNGIAWGDLG